MKISHLPALLVYTSRRTLAFAMGLPVTSMPSEPENVYVPAVALVALSVSEVAYWVGGVHDSVAG
jgi:hypothetical protein